VTAVKTRAEMMDATISEGGDRFEDDKIRLIRKDSILGR